MPTCLACCQDAVKELVKALAKCLTQPTVAAVVVIRDAGEL